MLGKAVYEGIVLEVPFAGFFLSKMLGRFNFLDELPSLDPTLHKNLLFLKHYEGDAEELALTFSVEEDRWGETVAVELKPGGVAISVTSDNKIQYIHLMANYRCCCWLHHNFALQHRGWVD